MAKFQRRSGQIEGGKDVEDARLPAIRCEDVEGVKDGASGAGMWGSMWRFAWERRSEEVVEVKEVEGAESKQLNVANIQRRSV